MNQAIDHATLEAAEALSSASCAVPRGKPQQFKRIDIEGLPQAVMLRKGGIRFRHYYVSVHAMDRFVERCGRPASEILASLHDAVLACYERAKSPGARRVIRTADERGGYVLFSGKVYFIMKVDQETGIHVVSTVMTPATMAR
ncbi:hypothetical protein ST4_038 [Aeromonas phage ST4]|nr:hypothetical protein ST4_038 [Aeromonas phage ST4]